MTHLCLRCAALTEAPTKDRCGRCRDWPEYNPQDPSVGDFARLAEHIHATRGQWTDVVMALMDAMKAASLAIPQENLDELDELARREAAGEVDLPALYPVLDAAAKSQRVIPPKTPFGERREAIIDATSQVATTVPAKPRALRVGDLRAALVDAAEDDLVAAEAADLPPHYVTAVQIEPQSNDGEGHVTSTGGTVWLALEES